MFIKMFSFLFHSCYYVFSFIYLLFSMFHTVLPYGIDVGLMSVTAYFMTKLKKPEPSNVFSVFGPEPGSKEGEEHPDRVIRCIAHRGAGLDAPENTLEAFKYCVNHDCNMVELDVRTSKDGKLVLLHDEGLQRLTGSNITNVHVMDWDSIKNIDVGFTHPNRAQFKEVHLCLLDDALDYLLENKVKVIIDIKGDNKQVINGILNTFSARPDLYKSAAITCFNPFVLYQIRKRDPNIVGALSYRPYCFSAQDYDAEQGAHNARYGDNLLVHAALRTADILHSLVWRWCARWCSVSAVLLHKDIVSPYVLSLLTLLSLFFVYDCRGGVWTEIYYWRSLGIRCAGWCVNRPLEKLYWRGVLKAPYLANTLLGEPEVEKSRDKDSDYDRAGPLIDKLLEPERRMSSGQN